MPRSTLGHYSLVAAAVAVLGGLIYVQMSDYLPDTLQITGPGSLRQQNPACALAEVPRDHVLVAASIFEGGAMTDLVIGTPPLVAKTVRVDVDQGDKPITVFLSGYGVIWQFVGDVGRVQRVIALSPVFDRRVAVAGIAADRVDFPERRDCSFFAEAMSPQDEMVRAKALSVLFGRRPDSAAYQHKAAYASLPHLRFGTRPEQASERGGSRVLDPAQVISAVPVIRPDLLPGEAGLAQLEAAGSIRRPQAEEAEEFIAGASRQYQSKLSPDYRLATKFDFVITREVTLPTPTAMQQWRFLVLGGVPAPRNGGRACIAQMDGFRVNNIDLCFAGAREGIERLRALPPAEKVGHCRLLEPPEEASLEAVSVYEPEKAGRGFADKPTPYQIDVRVEKAGAVVLVLNTYEPAVWRVSASADTRIVGVLLLGYHASSVEGIAADTPVVRADFDGHVNGRKPSPGCAPMHMWLGSAYQGGPDAMVLDRQVLALTGRNLDGLRGAYRLNKVEVR